MLNANCDIPITPAPHRRPWHAPLLLVGAPTLLFALSAWCTWNAWYATNLVALAPANADTVILLRKTNDIKHLVSETATGGNLAPHVPVSLASLIQDSQRNAAIYLKNGDVVGIATDNPNGLIGKLSVTGYTTSLSKRTAIITTEQLTKKSALRRPYLLLPKKDGLVFTRRDTSLVRASSINAHATQNHAQLTFQGLPLPGDRNHSPQGSASLASIHLPAENIRQSLFIDIPLNYPGILAFFETFRNDDIAVELFSDARGIGTIIRAAGQLNTDDSVRLAQDLLAYSGESPADIRISTSTPSTGNTITLAKGTTASVTISVTSTGTVITTRESGEVRERELPDDVNTCLSNATGYVRLNADPKLSNQLPTQTPVALFSGNIVAGNERFSRICW